MKVAILMLSLGYRFAGQDEKLPFVDEAVDSNLKHLVVLDGSVGHDDAVVEFIHGMAPFRRFPLVR